MYRGIERPVRSGPQLSRIDPQSPISLYEISILATLWDSCHFRVSWPIIQDWPHKCHSSIHSSLLQADCSIPRYIRHFRAKSDRGGPRIIRGVANPRGMHFEQSISLCACHLQVSIDISANLPTAPQGSSIRFTPPKTNRGYATGAN